MTKYHLEILVPGVFAATALALAVGVGAQATPPTTSAPAAKTLEATPMTGHDQHSAAKTIQVGDMRAECQAMMAKKKAMQGKLEANDAELDELVAEMNAAKASKERDALERPMAAVINELVAQRKASRPMMMEMQTEMMAHMVRHHLEMQGAKGAMECPMLTMGMAHEARAAETKPKT